MSAFSYCLLLVLLGAALNYGEEIMTESHNDYGRRSANRLVKQPLTKAWTETGQESQCPCQTVPRRRYDIVDVGYVNYFHGWVDVQGTGAANDYCRFVGNSPNIFLSCALAGTDGQSERNYNSAQKFDGGYQNTWYMRDEDGDGRDDYCRCAGDASTEQQVVCTKAGPLGFYGSTEQGGNTLTFTPTGNIDCSKRIVRPEFGRPNTPVIE